MDRTPRAARSWRGPSRPTRPTPCSSPRHERPLPDRVHAARTRRLLVTRDRAVIVSDGRFTTQLEQECPGLEAQIRPVGQTLIEAVAEVVGRARRPPARVRGRRSLSVADYEALREKLPTVAIRSASPTGSRRSGRSRTRTRSPRSARRSASPSGRSRCSGPGSARARSEKDVADALEGYLRRCGATAASFPPIVAVGPRSALPHARPDGRRPDRRRRLRARRLGGDRPALQK